MTKLELRNLVKRYGSVNAVDGVSLAVDPGQVVGLLGPSGCGKTTTLHMLAGFIQPDEGVIRLDGRVVQDLPPEKRNTGMVFQNYALFPHMTVAGNIGFGLEMRGCGKAEITERTVRALDLVHLSGLAQRYPRQLSGGQQQRVALARALVVEPSLLLLDEPLSNLDATLREEMRFEIREIQRRVGITTIFVTHDQTEAMAISDQVAVMSKGRIVQFGAPEQVYRAPANAFVAAFIGQASLIPAKVTDGSGAMITVTTSDGAILLAPAGGQAYTAGDLVEVVLRPEDVGVSAEPADGRNNLSVKVLSTTYLGASTRVLADGAGVKIAVLTQRREGVVMPGTRLNLVWNPEHCSLVAGRAGQLQSSPSALSSLPDAKI